MYELIEEHYRKNFTYLCKSMSGRVGGYNNAEDVVQEAYTRAMKYWNSFNHNATFEFWFNMILRKCVMDQNTANKNRGAVEVEEYEEKPIYFKQPKKTVIMDIEKMISEEKEPNRTILDLYYLKAYKQKDIEKIVDKSHKAIEHIILRFMKQMRKRLK